MNQGLFESLTGHFYDGTPIEDVPVKDRRMRSVMDHLSRIFNIRRGSIPHLKDYGIPDMSEIYRKMPDGIEELRDAIKETIEKYEPRMRNVRILPRESEGDKLKLIFMISGEITGLGLVRYETTFTSTGSSSISPWQRRE